MNHTTPDCSGANGITVELQSLEERVEKIESAVQAGNFCLQHASEATPANTMTVMSIDYSSGTTKYVNFDAAIVKYERCYKPLP
jgi:hypothetical protein